MGAYSFDINQAHIKKRPGRVSFTDVLAKVTSDARGADELPRSVSVDSRFDKFIDYVTAIWRYNRATYKGFTWEAAEELCKAARDSNEAIVMRIYLDNEFRPSKVIDYLK
ncbi:cell division protein SepF [Bacillus sp. NPDC077411]|uniref:cell division protein SepF n=1 Tax=Bacillus sp. NPDC077411 TaxID=3363947 RepID=UPI0037C79B9B